MKLHDIAVKPLTAACLLSCCVYAALKKPAVAADISQYSPNLSNAVQGTYYTVNQWPDDVIAESCLEQAGKNDLGPITTYEVTYANCGQTWILCRHVDAAIERETMFDVWGKIPVRMKQSVRSALWMPTSKMTDGAWAWTAGADQVYFGGWSGQNTYIHETIHAMDFSQAFKESNLGDSGVWKDAYNADSRVVSEYARTSFVEDLAETGVVALYDTIVSGGAVGLEPNIGQIEHQLAVVKDQAKNGNYGGDIFNPSSATTCTFRWANPRQVPKKSTSSRIKVRNDNHLRDERIKARAMGIQLYNDIPSLKSKPVKRTQCRL